MRKSFFAVTITVVIVTIAVGIYIFRKPGEKKDLTVEAIDNKGVFVGERRPQYKESDPSKWSPAMRKSVEDYEASVRAIDEASDNIQIGDAHSKIGQYEEAAVAYRKAYFIGGGSKAVSGLLLVEAYEKLGRYDEGIALLDEMIAKPYLSENGIKNANEIRVRLLAAKNAAVPQSNNA